MIETLRSDKEFGAERENNAALRPHLIHRFAVPLEVNCPAGAREATVGCPLKGKVKRGAAVICGASRATLPTGARVLAQSGN